MRIGYVVKRFPPETFVVTEVLAHEAAGWDVEIFALRPPVDARFEDSRARLRAPVTYLASKGLKVTSLWAALQQAMDTLPRGLRPLEEARGDDVLTVHQALVLAGQVRARGIDHLHAHFAASAATVARLAGRLAGVPFTFTAHGRDIFQETRRTGDLRRMLEDAAAVVTVSDFDLASLHAKFGAAAVRGRRVYNGFDLDRFPYTEPRARARRVVSVGRRLEKKGFEVLVEAAALLCERGLDFTVDLIGSGEPEGGLRSGIDDLGSSRRVRLLGPRPRAEIVRAVAEAAAFAAPGAMGRDGSRDGLPTMLLEAMALGTPCVSTDVTGIPEFVRDGETGLLVPPNDATALADALARLLEDPELRVGLAARARRRIEEDFDARRNGERLRQVLLEAHRGRPAAVVPIARAI